MFIPRSILCYLGIIIAAAAKAAQPSPRLYINYSIQPPQSDLLAYDLCLLDPHAKADLKPGQELGHRFLAYLSLVELAKGSIAEADAIKRGVPFLAVNEDWASQVMDVATQRWRDFIIEDAAVKAFAKGFDGLFLDTADAVANPAFKDKTQARGAIVAVIRTLHQRWPEKTIILNRGFDLLAEVTPCLSGVLVESVYQSFDPTTKAWRAVPEDGSRWLETRINSVKALKLPVYAVDYVDPTNQPLAEATVRQLLALGCVPLVTTPALNGVIIAPR